MQIIIKKFLSRFFSKFSTHYLKDDDSFSLKKFIVDDNPYQKYGLAAAGGTVVSFASILLMALLIATGEFLGDVKLRKQLTLSCLFVIQSY